MKEAGTNRFMNRRKFCKLTTLGLVGSCFPALTAVADLSADSERSLSFVHLHTGETLQQTTYWKNGRAQKASIERIFHILRDHRTDEIAPIDIALLDQLNLLNRALSHSGPLHVISGFRSESTNLYLRQKSQGGGVAKSSLHMEGRAIDIRVPGFTTGEIFEAAASMKQGGVGYYPGLKFVHMDTGPIKSWSG
ncbi:MAG: hypothetical protein C0623_13125 [Desulfuromonas sp.]|nr:MAG: hypothetical protein C0623_13125 [Desulfuromonas sp.]